MSVLYLPFYTCDKVTNTFLTQVYSAKYRDCYNFITKTSVLHITLIYKMYVTEEDIQHS